MNFYLFESEPRWEYAEVQSAVDSHNRAVFEKIFSDPPVSTECFLDLVQNKILTDRLSSVSLELVVSSKIADIIRGRNICPSIRSLQAKVRNKHRSNIATYEIFFTTKRHDAIDRRWSSIKWFNEHILRVEKYVLNAHLLPDFEMFKIVPNAWVVSEAIVAAITQAGCTGCLFTPIQVLP